MGYQTGPNLFFAKGHYCASGHLKKDVLGLDDPWEPWESMNTMGKSWKNAGTSSMVFFLAESWLSLIFMDVKYVKYVKCVKLFQIWLSHPKWWVRPGPWKICGCSAVFWMCLVNKSSRWTMLNPKVKVEKGGDKLAIWRGTRSRSTTGRRRTRTTTIVATTPIPTHERSSEISSHRIKLNSGSRIWRETRKQPYFLNGLNLVWTSHQAIASW